MTTDGQLLLLMMMIVLTVVPATHEAATGNIKLGGAMEIKRMSLNLIHNLPNGVPFSSLPGHNFKNLFYFVYFFILF